MCEVYALLVQGQVMIPQCLVGLRTTFEIIQRDRQGQVHVLYSAVLTSDTQPVDEELEYNRDLDTIVRFSDPRPGCRFKGTVTEVEVKIKLEKPDKESKQCK